MKIIEIYLNNFQQLVEVGEKVITRFGKNLSPGSYSASDLDILIGGPARKANRKGFSDSPQEFTIQSFLSSNDSCSYDEIILDTSTNTVVRIQSFFTYFRSLEKLVGIKSKDSFRWSVEPKGKLCGESSIIMPESRFMNNFIQIVKGKKKPEINMNLLSGKFLVKSFNDVKLEEKFSCEPASLWETVRLQEISSEIRIEDLKKLYGECRVEIYQEEVKKDKMYVDTSILIINPEGEQVSIKQASRVSNEEMLRQIYRGYMPVQKNYYEVKPILPEILENILLVKNSEESLIGETDIVPMDYTHISSAVEKENILDEEDDIKANSENECVADMTLEEMYRLYAEKEEMQEDEVIETKEVNEKLPAPLDVIHEGGLKKIKIPAERTSNDYPFSEIEFIIPREFWHSNTEELIRKTLNIH